MARLKPRRIHPAPRRLQLPPRTTGLPWTDEVRGELEALAEERLPEHLTTHIPEAREEAQRQAAKRETAQTGAEQADRELRGRLEAMSAPERLEALEAYGEEHGRYSQAAWRLRDHVQQLNAADEQAQAQEPEA